MSVRTITTSVAGVDRPTILRIHGERCFYCRCALDEESLTWDHFLPRARSGCNRAWNLVPACQPCNARKNDRLPTRAELLTWQRITCALPCYFEIEDQVEALFLELETAELVMGPLFQAR